LRTGGSANEFSTAQSPRQSPSKREKPLPRVGAEGFPQEGEWDVDSFSKRYPSLNKLEMVEREIPGRGVRDV
jgi:AP2-associated kinase